MQTSSPINNRCKAPGRREVKTQTFPVFRGFAGQSYSHQAQLASLGGRLFATWSLGIRDEEGPGQKMVLSISEDLGETWTPPTVIASPAHGEHAPGVVVSSGLLAFPDVLIAFSGEWERTKEGLADENTRNEQSYGVIVSPRTHLRVSKDYGATWSDPVTTVPNIAGYMVPSKTKSGRWILPGHYTYPYTDDPQALTGWTWAGIAPLEPSWPDTYFHMLEAQQRTGSAAPFNEGSWFEKPDDTLCMMLRREGHLSTEPVTLGVSESIDNGKTWNKPVLTEFTDSICRAHFGTLNDGRIFAMSCPENSTRWIRTPAILALSTDGVNFDRQFVLGNEEENPPKIPGLFKHGQYGYPFFHQVGEHGFMLFSRGKEDILISRFEMRELD